MISTWISETTRRSRRALLATAAIFYVATMYCAEISSISSLGLSLSFSSLPVRFFLLVLLAYFGLQYVFHLWSDRLNRPYLQAETDYHEAQQPAFDRAKADVDNYVRSMVRAIPMQDDRIAAHTEISNLFGLFSKKDDKDFRAKVSDVLASYGFDDSQVNYVMHIFERQHAEVHYAVRNHRANAKQAAEYEWRRFIFWDWVLPALVVVIFVGIPTVSAPACEPTGLIPFLP